MRKTLVVISLLITSFAIPSAVFADTVIPYGTNISGNVTWTKAASPYIVTGMGVAADGVLTIDPGTIVKFDLYGGMGVAGQVLVGAPPPAEPVTITSIRDDSVGGDSNSDGSATVPLAGDWNGIYLHGNGESDITNAVVRYGGKLLAPLILQSGLLVIDQSVISDAPTALVREEAGAIRLSNSTMSRAQYGVDSHLGATSLELATTTFQTLTVSSVLIDGSVNFINHGGNSGDGGYELTGNLVGNQTWNKDGLPYLIESFGTPPSSSLTILPGAVVKFHHGGGIGITGQLTVGSAVDPTPVTFTSILDDGVVVPPKGDWNGLYLYATSTLYHANFRYGGNAQGTLNNQGGVVTITGGSISQSGNTNFFQHAGTTVIEGTLLQHALTGVYVDGGSLVIHNANISGNTQYGVNNVTAQTIDATNNYWGAPDGPKHPIDLFDPTQGSGDQVSANVSFKPFQVLYGIPQGCTVNCNSNVLFLPGVAGSRLYEVSELDSERCGSDTGSSYFKRWLPVTNCDNTKLLLDVNGQSKNHIVTKDVIDEAGGLPNIYASFLADLRSWKFTDSIMTDYSVIPYDWRLSIGDILNKGKINPNGYIDYTQNLAPNETPFILSEFLRMASSSRTHKVTIIAHSNGGLIAKALMLQLRALGKENLVDKIVFVAVPEVGTPDAVATLLHGSDLGPLGVISDKRQTREISQNMPTAYNLLPSDAYYQTSISSIPVATFGASGLYTNERAMYGIGIGNSTELNKYLLGLEGRMMPDYSNLNAASIANPALLSSSHFTHSELDAWMPSSTTKMIEISGWGEYTIAGLQYTSEAYCARFHTETQFLISKNVCDEYAQKKMLKNTYTVNGDETVVVDSAHYLSDKNMSGVERWWLDIHSYNNAGFLGSNKNRYHKDILEVASLRNFIKNQIASTTSVLAYISTTKPSSLTDVIIYDLHSPLSLNLYDNDGRHTGISTTTGLIEENIPGTRYNEVGDTKYIIADAGIAQHLMLKGTASGSFSLGVQRLEGDTILASTTYSAIPSSTSTLVTLDLPINTDLISSTSTLKIDFNGDGVIDAQMASKPNQENVYDVTPPEVELSFNQVTQSLQVQGFDSVSSTTVATTASSTKVTDQAGNTTELIFSKYKIKPKKIELVISEIKQNGILVSTSTIPLTYKWNILNTGTSTMIKTLASYTKTTTSTVETHYQTKKGVTVVMTTPIDLDDNDDGDEVDARPTKEKLSGVHVIKLKVSGGKIYISY